MRFILKDMERLLAEYGGSYKSAQSKRGNSTCSERFQSRIQTAEDLQRR